VSILNPKWISLLSALAGVALLSGCTRDFKPQDVSMWNSTRLKPLEPLGEASSSRDLPPGTVARGELAPDDPVRTGRSGNALVAKIPIPVTEAVISRGQERFNIFCTPCHSRLGDGEGMVVQRGFPHPPNYGLVRLKQAPDGHIFDVITNGYGVMYSYASRIPAEDRWAIVAYVRVLQKTLPDQKVDPFLAQREQARRTGIQNH
jgi:mono/diheme cytochrome c family protein